MFPEPSAPEIYIYNVCRAKFECEAIFLWSAELAGLLQVEYGYEFTGICYTNNQGLRNDNTS